MYSTYKIRIASPRIENPVIIYSNHAQVRSIERRISPDDVKNVIRNPYESWLLTNGAMISSAVISGREIKVVFRIEGSKVFVITVEEHSEKVLRRES